MSSQLCERGLQVEANVAVEFDTVGASMSRYECARSAEMSRALLSGFDYE